MGDMIGNSHVSDEDRERLMLEALGGHPDKARRTMRTARPNDVTEHGVPRKGTVMASFPRMNIQIQIHEVAPSAPPTPRWTWVRFIGGQVRMFGGRESASSMADTSAMATFG